MLVKPVLPVLEYVVNYEYVSKVLCINKDKPKMHCNGKCHLMKELAKASDAEKPFSSDKKSTFQILDVLIFEEIKSADKYVKIKKIDNFGYLEDTRLLESNKDYTFKFGNASVFIPKAEKV